MSSRDAKSIFPDTMQHMSIGHLKTFVHLHHSLLTVNMLDAPNLEADGVPSHAAHTGNDEPQSGFEHWPLVQIVAAHLYVDTVCLSWSHGTSSLL